MGLLRFILAAAVVIGHSTPLPFLHMVDAGLSVSVFFIISGFYMAMILENKYRDRYFLFITNRWYRLAPTYYLILALSFVLYLAMSIYTGHPHDRLVYWVAAWNHGHWGAMLVGGLSQLTIVGLDLPSLFFYSPDTGYSLVGGAPGMDAGWRLLFVPQAWSISLEFMFYLVAPFLVRFSSWKLSLMALVSASLKIGLFYALKGGHYGSWTYEFFPTQFFLFILGILAFRHGLPLAKAFSKPTLMSCGGIFLLLILFGSIHKDTYEEPLTYVMALFAIPSLFKLTSSNVWDRKLGELSYPIYITHILVSWPLHGLHGQHGTPVSGALLLPVTILVSLAVYHWLEEPIDRWRQSRVQLSTEPAKKLARSSEA